MTSDQAQDILQQDRCKTDGGAQTLAELRRAVESIALLQSPARLASKPASRAAPPAAADLTREWIDYIERRCDERDRNLIVMIGDLLIDEVLARKQAIEELKRKNEQADALIETLQKQTAQLIGLLGKLETERTTAAAAPVRQIRGRM